jgi:hypothetical protein
MMERAGGWVGTEEDFCTCINTSAVIVLSADTIMLSLNKDFIIIIIVIIRKLSHESRSQKI